MNVLDARIAELRIAQARDGIVLVQPLLRLGGGLDVPLEQRLANDRGDFRGQQRLAGAGFALDQQRARQHHGGVHRGHQFGRWRCSDRFREIRGAMLTCA